MASLKPISNIWNSEFSESNIPFFTLAFITITGSLFFFLPVILDLPLDARVTDGPLWQTLSSEAMKRLNVAQLTICCPILLETSLDICRKIFSFIKAKYNRGRGSGRNDANGITIAAPVLYSREIIPCCRNWTIRVFYISSLCIPASVSLQEHDPGSSEYEHWQKLYISAFSVQYYLIIMAVLMSVCKINASVWNLRTSILVSCLFGVGLITNATKPYFIQNLDILAKVVFGFLCISQIMIPILTFMRVYDVAVSFCKKGGDFQDFCRYDYESILYPFTAILGCGAIFLLAPRFSYSFQLLTEFSFFQMQIHGIVALSIATVNTVLALHIERYEFARAMTGAENFFKVRISRMLSNPLESMHFRLKRLLQDSNVFSNPELYEHQLALEKIEIACNHAISNLRKIDLATDKFSNFLVSEDLHNIDDDNEFPWKDDGDDDDDDDDDDIGEIDRFIINMRDMQGFSAPYSPHSAFPSTIISDQQMIYKKHKRHRSPSRSHTRSHSISHFRPHEAIRSEYLLMQRDGREIFQSDKVGIDVERESREISGREINSLGGGGGGGENSGSRDMSGSFSLSLPHIPPSGHQDTLGASNHTSTGSDAESNSHLNLPFPSDFEDYSMGSSVKSGEERHLIDPNMISLSSGGKVFDQRNLFLQAMKRKEEIQIRKEQNYLPEDFEINKQKHTRTALVDVHSKNHQQDAYVKSLVMSIRGDFTPLPILTFEPSPIDSLSLSEMDNESDNEIGDKRGADSNDLSILDAENVSKLLVAGGLEMLDFIRNCSIHSINNYSNNNNNINSNYDKGIGLFSGKMLVNIAPTILRRFQEQIYTDICSLEDSYILLLPPLCNNYMRGAGPCGPGSGHENCDYKYDLQKLRATKERIDAIYDLSTSTSTRINNLSLFLEIWTDIVINEKPEEKIESGREMYSRYSPSSAWNR